MFCLFQGWKRKPSLSAVQMLLTNKDPFESNVKWIMDAILIGNDPNTKAPDGESILHKFVLRKIDKSVIKKLVDEYKADIHIKNKAGETPLQCVIKTTANYLIRDAMNLVRLNADANTKDEQGTPLLHRVLISGAGLKTIKELLEHKADVNLKDVQGNTALRCLMDDNNFDSKKALLLVEYGADPHTKDSADLTLMQRMRLNQAPLEDIEALQKAIYKKSCSAFYTKTKNSFCNLFSCLFVNHVRTKPLTNKQQKKLQQVEELKQQIFRL